MRRFEIGCQNSNQCGGQYDHNAVYIDTHAVHSGNLYNIHNIRETVGTISVGQAVQMHPDFWDLRDGE